LTAPTLATAIAQLAGQEYLYFYDAIAPIVTAESIDMTIAFRASRYDRGDEEEGDYINCPMNKTEYDAFVQAIRTSTIADLRDFWAATILTFLKDACLTCPPNYRVEVVR